MEIDDATLGAIPLAVLMQLQTVLAEINQHGEKERRLIPSDLAHAQVGVLTAHTSMLLNGWRASIHQVPPPGTQQAHITHALAHIHAHTRENTSTPMTAGCRLP
jgi:hypothetical protein